MQQYTIYCTKTQTCKALELGAPIKVTFADIPNKCEYEGCYVEIPTAEQMIGWLEQAQGMSVRVSEKAIYWTYDVLKKKAYSVGGAGFASRKEATLAAIDAALDYLM